MSRSEIIESLSKIRSAFNDSISNVKLFTSSLLELLPSQLIGALGGPATVASAADFASLRVVRTIRDSHCSSHTLLETELEQQPSSNFDSHLNAHKFKIYCNQTCVDVLVQCRYLTALASYFAPALSLPFRLVSNESQMGWILTPREIDAILSCSVDHSVYLKSLLHLANFIVEYTTCAIIRISVSPQDSGSRNQYLIALINQKLLQHIHLGFQSLDLKNDDLRRKTDGLKYSVQKINSQVYDLALRKLIGSDAL